MLIAPCSVRAGGCFQHRDWHLYLVCVVIKTLSYFPLQTALNSQPVISAALDALREKNITLKENSWNCDAALIWSVLWNGRMAPNQSVYEHYRNQGKPVIIFDVGLLHRERTWKVAVNNINAEGFYGHKENLDWYRPRTLGIKATAVTNQKEFILIAAQHARSLQVQKLGRIEPWVHKQIAEIRQVTDRPIIVRPHPRSQLVLANLPRDIVVQTPLPMANTYDNYDLDINCHAVVNYNSSPGVLAAMTGIRPVVDASSLAEPVSVSLDNIEKPYDIDRERWLVELCHTEYTIEEIKKGLWLKRIAPALTQ